MVSKILQICTVFYLVIGMGMSAVPSVSGFATVFALFGFIASFFVHRFMYFHVNYILVLIFYFCCGYFWSAGDAFQSLGLYAATAMGTVCVIVSIHSRLFSYSNVAAICLIPVVVNAGAYFLGINMTAIVFDIDYDLAMTRFSGLIGHPSAYVTRGVLPLFFILVHFSFVGSKIKKVDFAILLVAVLAVFFNAYVTGSKKSLTVGLPMVILAINYVLKLNPEKAQLLKGTMMAIFFSILLLLVEEFLSGNIEDVEVFRRFREALDGDDSSTLEREQLVFLGLNIFSENPFFGHGFDGFAIYSGVGYYSHNNHVDILVNYGIVGWLMYYIAFVFCFLKIILEKRNYSMAVCFLMVFLFFDFTGVSYSDRGSLLAFWALLGYSINSEFKNEINRPFN